MLDEKEKKELFGKLSETKKEISQLRSLLNNLNEEKEKFYSEKNSLSSTISTSINKIKSLKSDRDKKTNEVKKDKNERNIYNVKIRDKISEVIKLKEKNPQPIIKQNIKNRHTKDNNYNNPSAIKKQIEDLELKLETEVLSFDKEKGIIKNIKELKKTYDQLNNKSTSWKDINTKSKEIDELKKKAKEAHNKIQNEAKESQKKHEELIKTSKGIDDLKKKEGEAFNKFINLKKQFKEVNLQLKEKLTILNEFHGKLDGYKKDNKKDRKDKELKQLKNKEKIIQEKIKNGGKLTTEDILVMQGFNNK